MAKYRIPENFISAYELITKMSDNAVSVLAKGLETIRVGANPDEITNTLKQTLKNELSYAELKNVIEAIFSIYPLINIDKQSQVEEVISDLVESFSETQNKTINFTKFKANLQKLIQKGSRLDLTHKAFDLLSEYDKIYMDSRIISDIRIIFGNDLTNSQQEAAIIHQFKIEYHEKGSIKNAFFALDINDLEQLKKNIERAIEKDQQIRNNTYKNMSFILLKR